MRLGKGCNGAGAGAILAVLFRERLLGEHRNFQDLESGRVFEMDVGAGF